jgi:hypothetical protein
LKEQTSGRFLGLYAMKDPKRGQIFKKGVSLSRSYDETSADLQWAD